MTKNAIRKFNKHGFTTVVARSEGGIWYFSAEGGGEFEVSPLPKRGSVPTQRTLAVSANISSS